MKTFGKPDKKLIIRSPLPYIAVIVAMKAFMKARNRIILLIVIFQLLTTFCSKQLYPESAFLNLESQSEISELKDFMDAGYEKAINTHDTNADEIIKTAQKYLGVPHCMGGTSYEMHGLLRIIAYRFC